MRHQHLSSPLAILALLLAACNAYGNSQPMGALTAQPSAVAQNADPTAPPEALAKPTAVAAIDSPIAPNEPPDTCPVTRPPNLLFTPPSPYSESPGAGYFWHGSDALWTAVPESGVWAALPHNPEGYTQKVFWWRKGYSWTEEPEPQLTLSGRRLDAPAPPLNASRATNAFAADIGSAMLVGVDFPTPGCWEISGRYADAELSFVVWIAPEPRPPEIFFARPEGARGLAIAYDMMSGAQLFILPAGVASADWKEYFAASAQQGITHLEAFIPETGELDRSLTLKGDWALNGVSPSGRWAALSRIFGESEVQQWAAGEWKTEILIVDGQTGEAVHQLSLDGNFEVETVSADGKSLFLVEHLPAVNPDHYLIRLYDLSTETLVADPLRAKGSDEVMAGYAWEGLASPNGKWLLTLYLSTQRNAAFIHTLNLIDKYPVCIDLPSNGGSFGQLKYYTLSLAPDGNKVYAANAALGVVAEINLNEFSVTRILHFDSDPTTSPDVQTQIARSLLSPDGAKLYFTSGQDVWAYDTKARTVSGPFLTDGQVSGLGLTNDGQRLYVALMDGALMAFDTASGVALR